MKTEDLVESMVRLTDAINRLADILGSPPNQSSNPTKADVVVALSQIPRPVAVGLLANYGATKLSEIPTSRYAEVIRMAEIAKIR